mgnify:CR=1 FL=1
MPQNILLAVTGMSPQVITETLYAIHKNDLDWPDRIEVVTTRLGKNKVMEGLLNQGFLGQLCQDYDRAVPQFSEQTIHVVPDANGQPVDDARTLEDHEALADFITKTVCELTADDDQGAPNRLHASLAGGRKTMTFYLGYAMSLFGRLNDRLSHVLVSQPFEGLPDFYYPTPGSTPLVNREGVQLDARDAEVVLADIPFVRHREYLPKAFKHLRNGLKFRDLIDLINMGAEPQAIRVILDDDTSSLRVQREGVQYHATVPMGLAAYAFYRMLIRLNQSRSMRVRRPTGKESDEELAYAYMAEVFDLLGIPFSSRKTLAQLVDTFAEADSEADKAFEVTTRTISSLTAGMKAHFLSTRVNEISSDLATALPDRLHSLLVPRQLQLGFQKVTEAELKADNVTAVQGGGYMTMLDAGQFEVPALGNQGL